MPSLRAQPPTPKTKRIDLEVVQGYGVGDRQRDTKKGGGGTGDPDEGGGPGPGRIGIKEGGRGWGWVVVRVRRGTFLVWVVSQCGDPPPFVSALRSVHGRPGVPTS